VRCQTGDLKGKGRWVLKRPRSQEKSPLDLVERAISKLLYSGESLPVSVQHLGSKRFDPHNGKSYSSNFLLNNIVGEFCQIIRMAGRCMKIW
jgi:hypothetical protein